MIVKKVLSLMGSKAILILGVIFVFLVNVLAVHNFINTSYYKSLESDSKTLFQDKPIKDLGKKFDILSNEDGNGSDLDMGSIQNSVN
jgi:hypothetical protein